MVNERQPLINYLKVQDKTDREMLRMLRQLDAEIASELRGYVNRVGPGAQVRAAQLRGVQREIRSSLADFYRQTGRVVQAGRMDAAAAAVDTLFDYSNVLRAAGLSPAEVQVMRRSAEQTAKVGLQHAMKRYTTSKIPLSQQVYRTSALTSGMLDRRIAMNIARGSSAREFAADIRSFVNPRTRGGVRYASMRLARTELNNAFHATSIDQADQADWVEGVKWNLSRSHPKKDECDELAKAKPFPPKKVPSKPHPQCLCFLTFEIMEEAEFQALVKAGKYD